MSIEEARKAAIKEIKEEMFREKVEAIKNKLRRPWWKKFVFKIKIERKYK